MKKNKEKTVFQQKCIVHTWGYEKVDEMSMQFRVCEKCGALEGRSMFRNGVVDKWQKFSPRGGRGFIDALRQKILHDKIAAEAELNKDAVKVDTADAETVYEENKDAEPNTDGQQPVA